jgi:3-phenylpropionate/trans-cinnamate dioxygenase ferredoxin reductase subunit
VVEKLVVVGTGHAASALVSSLARHHFQGSIAFAGDETHPPYNRPPLSKKFLSEEVKPSELYFRSQDQLAASGIEVHLGDGATKLDTRSRTVTLASGKSLAYSTLVLATGAAARALPDDVDRTEGSVHFLRKVDDALRLKADLSAARTIAIVGAGYVGLEVAASCASLGKQVIVVEAASRVLARVAGDELAGIVQRVHEGHGVSFRLETAVTRVAKAASGLDVELSSGDRLTADIVLCAIGAVPNTDLAEAAGLAVDRGIVTDSRCLTTDDRIYAIGDCAVFPRDGALVRLESVQNASDQAEIVARRICGLDARYEPLPWFWSDQYDLRLQSVGLATGAEGTIVRSTGTSHSIWHHRGGRIVALDTINASRDHMLARKVLARGDLRLDSLQEVGFDLSRIWAPSGQRSSTVSSERVPS